MPKYLSNPLLVGRHSTFWPRCLEEPDISYESAGIDRKQKPCDAESWGHSTIYPLHRLRSRQASAARRWWFHC